MHKESDVQVMDFIEIRQINAISYNVHVVSMNDAIMHVKADLEQLGTSVISRPVNLIYNYSELVRTLESL